MRGIAASLVGVVVAANLASSAGAAPDPGGLSRQLERDGVPAAIAGPLAQSLTGASLRSEFSGEGILLRTAVSGNTPVIISSLADAQTWERAASPDSEATAAIQIGYVSTPRSVELAWTPVKGAESYRVYWGETLVATVTEAHYVDKLVAKRKRPVEATALNLGYTVTADVRLEPEPVVDPETGETVYPDRWMGYSAFTPVLLAPAKVADLDAVATDFMALVAANEVTTLNYKTFISSATAPGFPCVAWPTNTYFGGDNRGYSSTSNAYRTRVGVTTVWYDGSVLPYVTVSPTRNYNNNGTLRETRTASTSGMFVSNRQNNGTNASFTIDHSAGNPFCTSYGTIRYVFNVYIAKSGSWSTSGYRRPVPNHEAYIQQDFGYWQTILRLGNSGFHCLTGICGTQGLSYSGTY